MQQSKYIPNGLLKLKKIYPGECSSPIISKSNDFPIFDNFKLHPVSASCSQSPLIEEVNKAISGMGFGNEGSRNPDFLKQLLILSFFSAQEINRNHNNSQ